MVSVKKLAAFASFNQYYAQELKRKGSPKENEKEKCDQDTSWETPAPGCIFGKLAAKD